MNPYLHIALTAVITLVVWWIVNPAQDNISFREWLAHYPTRADPERWERLVAERRGGPAP